MSNDDEATVFNGRVAHQFGEDFKEPGEPFSGSTLDTIRALVSEDETGLADTLDPSPFAEDAKARDDLSVTDDGAASTANQSPDPFETDAEWINNPDAEIEWQDTETDTSPDLVHGSWRRLHVSEGRPGRAARHLVASPRLLSLTLLSWVVIWKPWFIPSLALVIVCALLLVGTLIGQDRMARFVLFILKRFVWSEPALGRALQKVLPRRVHPVLYRPLADGDLWEGPIDPSFAARLLRLQSLRP